MIKNVFQQQLCFRLISERKKIMTWKMCFWGDLQNKKTDSDKMFFFVFFLSPNPNRIKSLDDNLRRTMP